MILVIGAGFAGSYLLRNLCGSRDEEILATVSTPEHLPRDPACRYTVCDVTKPEDLRALTQITAGEPLTVFYFAACHNVDYLFTHPAEGRKVNIDALDRFLNTVPNIVKLFFASTDCVYGESAPGSPLKETDETHPVNVYGRQKLEAEALVLRRGFTAVRFPYMLGPSLLPKKHFYDAVCEKLRAGNTVEMIDGMVRSALTYETAMRLLAELSLLPPEKTAGAVNLCGDAGFTKYELGLRIARRVGAPERLIVPIPEAEGQRFFKDRRASRTEMDNTKLKTLLGTGTVPLEV